MSACAAAASRRSGRSARAARSTRLVSEARYGWVVVAAAFTLMFVGFASAYSFAAFFGAFESEFHASRGDIALVFSVAAFLWFLLGAPGGVIADRFGARRVALAGVVCLAAALWLASRAAPPGAPVGALRHGNAHARGPT